MTDFSGTMKHFFATKIRRKHKNRDDEMFLDRIYRIYRIFSGVECLLQVGLHIYAATQPVMLTIHYFLTDY